MTGRIRLPLLLATAGIAMASLALTTRAARHEAVACHAPAIDTGRARRLQDAVERTAGRGPDTLGYSGLEAAALAVTLRGRCLAIVTLSHDGELGGGVVLVDPARPRENSWVVGEYAGAREPFAAGEGRAGFTYTTGRGSGLYESRVVVLCALEAETWDECLSVTRDKRTSVVGSKAPINAEQSASVNVVGDTLVVQRTVIYEREGEPTRRIRLAASRIVLPPAH